MLIELDLTVKKISKAKSAHVCSYCKGEVKAGSSYMRITVRKKGERFPSTLAVCGIHKPELIPLGLLLNGKVDK